MSSDELKENMFYTVKAPFAKGVFQYLGEREFSKDSEGRRKHIFQHSKIDIFLTEDEITWHVHETVVTCSNSGVWLGVGGDSNEKD